MTRRQLFYAAACLFVLVTLPAFAWLCRGTSPSRFAPDNLPCWERTPPRSARVAVGPRPAPALAAADIRADGVLQRQLEAVSPDDLFRPLEDAPRGRPSPAGGGRPGLWLQTACALGRGDAHLRRERDDVAQRLMEAQAPDGYLAAGRGRARWAESQIDAYAQNLRGLLAFYAVSHSPAPIYTAMQAGNLVVSEFPTVPQGGRARPGTAAPDPLLLPMTELYLMTGQSQFRTWATHVANRGTDNGAGLCALYQATGERRYLRAAQRLWDGERACRRADPDLAASLWTLTGAAAYARALGLTPVPCPLAPGHLALPLRPKTAPCKACVA